MSGRIFFFKMRFESLKIILKCLIGTIGTPFSCECLIKTCLEVLPSEIRNADG